MGATGVIKKKRISVEEILAITQGGWDVFVKEIGRFPVCKSFKHPLKRDKSPSGAIFSREGIWFLKDFAGKFPTMTAIQFVQRKYSLDFKEAMDKICQDMGINPSTKEYKPIQIFEKAPIYEQSDIHIGFSDTKWKKEHHLFWKNTEVTEAHCRKYDAYAVKECSINRKKVRMGLNEVVWAYYVEEIDRVKLYFPEREKKLRHRGNVPNNHIWNLHNVGECDKLIAQKSFKDLLVTTMLTPCVVALQNEDAKLFVNAETGPKLEKCGKEIFLAFGSDEHGVENSKILTDEYGYKWVNPPNKYLKEDINDAYSLAHKYGLKAWEECLKKKKII